MKSRQTISDTVKQKIKIARDKYRLSGHLVVWILITPFILILLLTVLSTTPFLDIHPIIWGENKLVESIQFPIFALAGIQSLVTAWHTKKQIEKPMIWGFYTFFSLGMFFIALEEVAWGQQFFGFKSPAFMLDMNVQNEFTFHNVEILQDKTDILNLCFGIGGVVGLWLEKRGKFTQIGIPRILTPWLFLIITTSLIGVWVDLFVEVRPVNYSIHIQTETTELMIAITGFLYAWLNFRAFVFHSSRTVRGMDVYLKDDKLSLTTLDDVLILIPINQIPGLVSAGKRELEHLALSKDRTHIHMAGLKSKIPISRLLKTAPSEDEVAEAGSIRLKRGVFWTALIAGFMSVVWLALIPGDPKNAWFLGLSKMRLSMFLIGGTVIILIAYLLWKSTRKLTGNQDKIGVPKSFRKRPPWFKIIATMSALGIFTTGILLVFSFLQPNPSIRGILSRLAPSVFWVLVLLCEVFVLSLTKVLKFSRLKLARATQVAFSQDRMIVTLKDGRAVSVSMILFPKLHNATDAERENVRFPGGGIRLKWPRLGINICAEGLLAGFEPVVK
jgi:hypothetical protein